jgi:hypothetical protein
MNRAKVRAAGALITLWRLTGKASEERCGGEARRFPAQRACRSGAASFLEE